MTAILISRRGRTGGHSGNPRCSSATSTPRVRAVHLPDGPQAISPSAARPPWAASSSSPPSWDTPHESHPAAHTPRASGVLLLFLIVGLAEPSAWTTLRDPKQRSLKLRAWQKILDRRSSASASRWRPCTFMTATGSPPAPPGSRLETRRSTWPSRAVSSGSSCSSCGRTSSSPPGPTPSTFHRWPRLASRRRLGHGVRRPRSSACGRPTQSCNYGHETMVPTTCYLVGPARPGDDRRPVLDGACLLPQGGMPSLAKIPWAAPAPWPGRRCRGAVILTRTEFPRRRYWAGSSAEVMSDIIQIVPFKSTGRRVSAWLHCMYHFELGGWTRGQRGDPLPGSSPACALSQDWDSSAEYLRQLIFG